MPDEKKEDGTWSKVIVGVLVAILAGGTTPWWWGKIVGGNQPSPSLTPSQAANPSSPANLLLPEKYEFEENGKPHAFVHISDKVWKEQDAFGKEYATFKEIERGSEYITIYDVSREMKIKIPIEGGNILMTYPQQNWVNFPYRYVIKKNNT